MPRKNPILLTLTNPRVAPKAWANFHYADPRDAAWVSIPDIPGVPTDVWALGFWTGIEWEGGGSVSCRWSKNDGPWLISSNRSDKKLWIVARHASHLAKLEDGRRSDGDIIKAILYIPSKTSGKYVPGSSFRHVFGDGGRLPKHRWHESYPLLRKVASNAYEVVAPRTNGFYVAPAGITG